VKPKPVFAERVLGFNATCLTLAWKTEPSHKDKTHRITYKGKWNGTQVMYIFCYKLLIDATNLGND